MKLWQYKVKETIRAYVIIVCECYTKHLAAKVNKRKILNTIISNI